MKLIKTESEYQDALKRIDQLFDCKPGTPEADEFELLVKLVEFYEEEKYHIDFPDPIEAIKFRMEQEGLSQKDLIPYFGTKSKVSEVLNRKRGLSLNMIRKLSTGLNIPAAILVQ